MPKSVSAKSGNGSGRTGAARNGRFVAIVSSVVLLTSVLVRLKWERDARQAPPLAVRLSMDDSNAVIPLSPPPVPHDNGASLIKVHPRILALAASSKIQDQQEAADEAAAIGDLWTAETTSRAILQHNAKFRPARLSLARSLREQARFDSAAQIYTELLNEDHRDSDAYLGLADTAFEANDRPTAFDWLAKGVKDGVQTPLALSTIAHRYQDWKDYPRAQEAISAALKVAPSDIGALLQQASIEVESGNLDAGYRTLDSIFKLDPNNGVAHRLLGVVLMNATYSHPDLNRARSLLERAVELNGQDPAIYRAAAVIYRQQRLYHLAAQAYDALLHLDPTSTDGRYGLGQVYALLGKPDLSRQQLALYKQLDERQRQETRLSEEVLHNPRNSRAHATLARFLESSGDYARALPQYQTAAVLQPGDEALWTDMKRLYVHLGWPEPVRKHS